MRPLLTPGQGRSERGFRNSLEPAREEEAKPREGFRFPKGKASTQSDLLRVHSFAWSQVPQASLAA